MAVITGSNADVYTNTGTSGAYETALYDVQTWEFETSTKVVSYTSNKTAGIEKKLATVKSAKGKIGGVYDPVNPVHVKISETTAVTLRLTLTTSHYIVVPAVITALSYKVDIDSGETIEWSADFEATAAWTYPSAVSPLVASADGPMFSDSLERTAQQMGAVDHDEKQRIADLATELARIKKHLGFDAEQIAYPDPVP